jgi:probable F420-dependent oxidoreductase
MRFALFYEIPVPRPWGPDSERVAYLNTIEQAVAADKLGWDAFWTVEHHFLEEYSHCSNPEVLYGAIAAKTENIRLGYGVRLMPKPYNHPVRTAESVAVLDIISGGRVDLGTGRSSTRAELEGFGVDPHATRQMWQEAIGHVVGCWTNEFYEFEGEHWSMPRRRVQPKPVQQPHPPFLIGGGAPRVLRLAGREADIVGVNPAIRSGNVDEDAGRDMAPGITDRKLEWVREGAGDRFDDIELNMLVFAVIVTDDRDDLVAKLAPRFGLSTEELADSPHVWIGTTAQIADDLRRWRDRWGVSYWVVQGPALEAVAPVVAELAGA